MSCDRLVCRYEDAVNDEFCPCAFSAANHQTESKADKDGENDQRAQRSRERSLIEREDSHHLR